MEQMESNNNLNTEAVIFTDAAAMKVGSLLTVEENPDLNLRVYVTVADVLVFNTVSPLMRIKMKAIQKL